MIAYDQKEIYYVRLRNLSIVCVVGLGSILFCGAIPNRAAAVESNQPRSLEELLSAGEQGTFPAMNPAAAHPLLDALVLEPSQVNFQLPASLQAPTLGRGCEARFQELSSRPSASPLHPVTGSVDQLLQGAFAADASPNQRTFFRNGQPICTEIWEGAPEQSLLRKVVIPGETVALRYDGRNRLIELTRTDSLTGNEPRVTRTQHYAGGQITIDGPRDDVDDIQHLTLDEDGNIVEFINAAGHRYLTEFDAHGRRIAWEGPNGERREYEYNPRGQIALERSAPGTAQQVALTLQYDEAGRLVASQRTGEETIWRHYEADRRLARVSDRSGAQLHLRYGGAGRLQEIAASREFGRQASALLSGSARDAGAVLGAYPETSVRPPAAPAAQPRPRAVDYQFDELERVAVITMNDGDAIRYDYNGFGDVIAEHSEVSGTTRFGYDAGGNRIWEARPDGTEIRRDFDALGRPGRVRYQRPGSPMETIEYRYDDCNYGVGRLCRITSAGGISRYEYDMHGNMVRLEKRVLNGGLRKGPPGPGIALSPLDDGIGGAFAEAGKEPLAVNSAGAAPAISSLSAIDTLRYAIDEFYWDDSCSAGPAALGGRHSLWSAWYAGFRSFTARSSIRLFFDSSFSIELHVGVCYRLQQPQIYYFPYHNIYYLPPATANPDSGTDSDAETEENEEEVQSWPPIEHDYAVDTEICSTADSWCKIENIACWGRRYHAPNKYTGYGKPVKHGETAILTYEQLGFIPTYNPIRVATGPEFGLSEHAVAQITQHGHSLHNEDMGEWGDGEFGCPKPVEVAPIDTPETERTVSPAHCNQVYRVPYEHNGKIYMHTRGTGNSGPGLDNITQNRAPGLFGGLDGEMVAAINADSDHLCPEYNPPQSQLGVLSGFLP